VLLTPSAQEPEQAPHAVSETTVQDVVQHDLPVMPQQRTERANSSDLVLKELAGLLQAQTRTSDVVSRMGVKSFWCCYPARGSQRRSKAEQIRAAVERLALRSHGKSEGPISVSIGVGVFPQHGVRGEDLLRAADEALYRAKSEGRNRVVCAE
jgi:diguanylate cyclase (GGDEF)-like protein